MKKIIAIILSVCMLLGIFVFTSTAEGFLSRSFDRDIITFGLREKVMTYTPEKSGVYFFYSFGPENPLGKLLNLFNRNDSDPYIEIYDGDGEFVGSADDNNMPYVPENYQAPRNFMTYVYLNAGETYEIHLGNFASEHFIPFLFNGFRIPVLSAFACTGSYIGDINSIELDPLTKTVFSVDKGEASYDEDLGYLIDCEVLVKITLDDGRRLTLDSSEIMDFDWDYYDNNCYMGRNDTMLYCLGQEIPYSFTIVE